MPAHSAAKLPSLSIFFCFMNDAGTVLPAITDAFRIGSKLAKQLEVISIHGGASTDQTWAQILLAKKKFPGLVVIDRSDNQEGYAVIKVGLWSATQKWVFYTDGDLQYDLADLPKLVAAQLGSGADVVNGYKQSRGDHLQRVWFGEVYRRLARWLFQLPIRDIDCDFRLIRKASLNKTTLTATNAAILADLITQLKKSGAQFVEVPVAHHNRTYGKSNYKVWQLFTQKIIGDLKVFWKLHS